ncbi:hypothetical protein RhiirC2_756587 [Rhizophagus irregularis]|uniref:Uncharacterized protein n=1 Tax=Rhizophagus irregularis TaxID=588596 RepID=A0A2N1MSC7_9GLOM|nr:hypothetical protein RhiirC2_756587 [Rhizophagus irregularis]
MPAAFVYGLPRNIMFVAVSNNYVISDYNLSCCSKLRKCHIKVVIRNYAVVVFQINVISN